jgi:hypothetical protein
MKIEAQVCTFQQAKRLKELGVDQKSYFVMGESRRELCESWMLDGNEDVFVSMFTVAELGVMLPGIFDQPKKSTTEKFWYYQVVQHTRKEFPTEAQARADVLLYLLEKKVVTAGDVNAGVTTYELLTKNTL